MKLFIASDIHGSQVYCDMLIDRIKEESPDKILLLGDFLYHGPRNDLSEGYNTKSVAATLNEYASSIVAVRGNCDAEVDQMMLDFECMADSISLPLENDWTIFATHGHLYSPNDLPSDLPEKCIFCTGHTHVKHLEYTNDIVFLNPGSISLPRDESHSYATLEDTTIALKALHDGTVLQSLDRANL